jgi:flagellar hook-length control protein FliK
MQAVNIMQPNVQMQAKDVQAQQKAATAQKSASQDKTKAKDASSTKSQDSDFKSVLAKESKAGENPADKAAAQTNKVSADAADANDEVAIEASDVVSVNGANGAKDAKDANGAKDIADVVDEAAESGIAVYLNAVSSIGESAGEKDEALSIADVSLEISADKALAADASPSLEDLATAAKDAPVKEIGETLGKEQNLALLKAQNDLQDVQTTVPLESAALKKQQTMKNLDFLAKSSVQPVNAETEATVKTIEPSLTAETEVKTGTAELSGSLKAGEVQASENDGTELFDAALDKKAEMEAVSGRRENRTATVRAVRQAVTKDKLLSDLSTKLDSLNKALGIEPTELSTEISSEPGGAGKSESQPFMVNSLLASDITSDSIAPDKAAESLPRAREDYDIPQQIVEQARLIKNGDSSEMVIKLKPAHLGELTLRVVVGSNGSVSALFKTENPEVRSIIESSMFQLKQELQQQGLKVDSIDVYSGQDQLFGGESGSNANRQQQNSHSRTINWAEFEEENALPPAEEAENGSSTEVNYLV